MLTRIKTVKQQNIEGKKRKKNNGTDTSNVMAKKDEPLENGLVWFHGISTIVGYLMPNPFLYILTVMFQAIQFSISIVFGYTQLNVKTVLFQAIQFSISTQFSPIWSIGCYLGEMETKRYSAFLKAPALLEPHHRIIYCHIQNARWGSFTAL